MVEQLTELELFDEFLPLDLNSVFVEPIRPLIMTAIVNPWGPTLSGWFCIGEFKPGNTVGIATCTLNPFNYEIFQQGNLILGKTFDTRKILDEIPTNTSWSCPSLCLVSNRVSPEKVPGIVAGFITRFKNSKDVLTGIRKYFGNPWDRVSNDIKGSFDAIIKSQGKEEGDDDVDDDEARELAKLILDKRHILPEFKAFMAALDGSIEHGAKALVRLDAQTIRAWFIRLAEGCHWKAL